MTDLDSAPDRDLSESFEQALELNPMSCGQCSSTTELGSDSSECLPTSKCQSPLERTPTLDSDEADNVMNQGFHTKSPRSCDRGKIT